MLRKILPLPNEDYRKWTLDYYGLYIVKKVFSRGALILTSMDEEDVIKLMNSDFIKEYCVICFHQ